MLYVNHESGFQVDFYAITYIKKYVKIQSDIVNCQLVGHNQQFHK